MKLELHSKWRSILKSGKLSSVFKIVSRCSSRKYCLSFRPLFMSTWSICLFFRAHASSNGLGRWGVEFSFALQNASHKITTASMFCNFTARIRALLLLQSNSLRSQKKVNCCWQLSCRDSSERLFSNTALCKILLFPKLRPRQIRANLNAIFAMMVGVGNWVKQGGFWFGSSYC